jgi:two-component system, NtrC family, sensor histidine kinase HydH
MERLLAAALAQDVSQLAVEERQELLSRLLARLAHEIRNPLSSLDIHVQLLEEDLVGIAPDAKEKLSGRLEIIQGELHRLKSIMDHFLRLAGPSALDLEPVEIARLVSHVCELLRPEAAAREIDIEARVQPGLPPVTADPVRLTQALLNLVINAMQAIERKGRIEVNARVVDTSLSIAVRDTGPGIPPEKFKALFDPYFTTKPEGNGLGLWIAQQIVTAHGGGIQVQNVAEGGAQFTLLLPLSS